MAICNNESKSFLPSRSSKAELERTRSGRSPPTASSSFLPGAQPQRGNSAQQVRTENLQGWARQGRSPLEPGISTRRTPGNARSINNMKAQTYRHRACVPFAFPKPILADSVLVRSFGLSGRRRLNGQDSYGGA